MRGKPSSHANRGKRHVCGGFGFAGGRVGKGFVRIPYDSGKWDCPKCVHYLIKYWMPRVERELRGTVLYTISSKLCGKELAAWIRKNIKKKNNYFCVHLADVALVFSNARFTDTKAINRKKLLAEIKGLMEGLKVKGMSTRKGKGHSKLRNKPWSYVLMTEDILPEYRKCKNDYEIGLLLMKYDETTNELGERNVKPTRLGKELMNKINAGEINADKPDMPGTLQDARLTLLNYLCRLTQEITSREMSNVLNLTRHNKLERRFEMESDNHKLTDYEMWDCDCETETPDPPESDMEAYLRLKAESKARGEDLSGQFPPHSCWGYDDIFLDRLAMEMAWRFVPEEKILARIGKLQAALSM